MTGPMENEENRLKVPRGKRQSGGITTKSKCASKNCTSVPPAVSAKITVYIMQLIMHIFFPALTETRIRLFSFKGIRILQILFF